MMENLNRPHVTRLRKTIGAMLDAHAAIRSGVADHAEKHEARVDDARRKAEESKAISDGVARANAAVRGNPQVG